MCAVMSVADGKNMDQIEEGNAPFGGLSEDAADVQNIPTHAKPSCELWKNSQKRHKIILNNSIATLINKGKNEMVIETILDDQTST